MIFYRIFFYFYCTRAMFRPAFLHTRSISLNEKTYVSDFLLQKSSLSGIQLFRNVHWFCFGHILRNIKACVSSPTDDPRPTQTVRTNVDYFFNKTCLNDNEASNLATYTIFRGFNSRLTFMDKKTQLRSTFCAFP